MGGPCLHCQGSQPEHAGLSCDQVKANRVAVIRALKKEAEQQRLSGRTKRVIIEGEVYAVTVDDHGIYIVNANRKSRQLSCVLLRDSPEARALAHLMFDALPDSPPPASP